METSEFMAKARHYLSVKQAIESANETLKALDAELKAEMVERNLKKLEVDGRSISLVQYPQRSIDANALRELISAATFKTVTEPKVKTELFDSAVLIGKIPSDVADKVTQLTPVSQLRVGK